MRCWTEAQGLVGCQEGQIQGGDPDPPETPGSNLPFQVHKFELALLRPPGPFVFTPKSAPLQKIYANKIPKRCWH